MELVAALLNGLRERSSDAATFIPQQSEQTDCSPAQLRRDVKKGGHIKRSEDRRQPDDENHARPHDLPGTDLQIQARKPIASDGQDRKARRHEVTRVYAAA